MDEKNKERFGAGTLFGFGLLLITNIDNVKTALSNNLTSDQNPLSLVGSVAVIIAMISILLSILIFITTYINLKKWRKRMLPITLIIIGLVFFCLGIFIWSRQDKSENVIPVAEIKVQKEEPLSPPAFAIIPPDRAKTEITQYEIEENEKDDKTQDEIYEEIYVIGIKNISDNHKTIEDVTLKSRVSMPKITKIKRGGLEETLQELSPDFQKMKIYKTDKTSINLNPDETVYFQIAYSYSLSKPAFSRKSTYLMKPLPKNDYLKMRSSAKNGGLFMFEQNIEKVGDAIIHWPFRLKYDPSMIPMSIFSISAKDNQPQYFRLEVLGSDTGDINFQTFTITKKDSEADHLAVFP